MSVKLALLDLERCFDFDAYLIRQRNEADGRSCVPSVLAQDFNEKVGATIDHLGMSAKIGSTIDHAEYLHGAADAIQVTKRFPSGCKYLQANGSRCLVGVIQADLRAHLAPWRVV